SWLDQLIGWNGHIHEVLTRRLVDRYQYVIAFHGCRAASVKTYQEQGLRVCNPKHLNETARQIFGNHIRLDAAIANLQSDYTEHNRGRIFFCLSFGNLVEHCGHYLLYGSEYLGAIGAYLGRMDELQKVGRATVVECRVPIRLIPRNYLRCLAGDILEEIFERQLDPEYRSEAL